MSIKFLPQIFKIHKILQQFLISTKKYAIKCFILKRNFMQRILNFDKKKKVKQIFNIDDNFKFTFLIFYHVHIFCKILILVENFYASLLHKRRLKSLHGPLKIEFS